MYSCRGGSESIPVPMTEQFASKFSEYNVYIGTPENLSPTSEFQLFQLSSSLFVDYSEKQRLIKIPEGQTIIYLDNDLPNFPEGTIIVKTFYYYNDERDTTKGKNLIESRLLNLKEGEWNDATYIWNQQQTDADLNLARKDITVSNTILDGSSRTLSYRVPSQSDCIACHQTNSEVMPIGPKIRNLNTMVEINNQSINQLTHFQSIGLLQDFNVSESCIQLTI